MMSRRTSGSPPVMRSLRTPRATNTEQTRSSSSRVRRSFFGRKLILRDAVEAAEVAAVRHRDAQVADRPSERIDQRAGDLALRVFGLRSPHREGVPFGFCR